MNENLEKQVSDLQKQLEELKTLFSKHTHSGNDGSQSLYNDITQLKSGSQYSVGSFHIAEATQEFLGTGELIRGALSVGKDKDISGGRAKNSFLFIDHYPTLTGQASNSFMFGGRNPIGVGSRASTTVGSAVVTQDSISFQVNELVGAYMEITNPATGLNESHVVLSNTGTSITTDGTWSFASDRNATFQLSVPIYLGAANYPFRRAYVHEGTGAGVRFGGGSTGAGQNGLLFMDSEGDLYWRDKDGVSTKLN